MHAGHMPGTPGLPPHAAPSVTSTAAGAPWAQPPSSGHPGKVTGTTGRRGQQQVSPSTCSSSSGPARQAADARQPCGQTSPLSYTGGSRDAA